MTAQLTASSVAEIAAWMRRWRDPLPVDVETKPYRVVAHQPHGVLVFDADVLKRLLPKEG